MTCNPSAHSNCKRAASAYSPTIEDVFSVRRLLLHFVPAELAISIVELAEYWPRVTTTREAFSGPGVIPTGGSDGEWCYSLSPPIPSDPERGIKPRRITFHLECVSECTYDSICSTFTLFHAAIIKPQDISQNIMRDPVEEYPERTVHSWNISNPKRWLVQDIAFTWPEGMREQIVWDEDDAAEGSKQGLDPLLHNLTSGDRIAVMVRGLIPGWMNCVYTITTDIHYSI
ncbi:hypothetical protein CC2G_003319 [Coprinopsis cinerea AmutBmut pab1-1]|nr:hypothetical protein CC2G_003319 [Coprinopsis cinerea AmutBmut pab1-1]